MLTEEEKKEIDHHVKMYPQKRAGCIEALKVVQHRRRWISDESLKDIADHLDMTTEELDSVATFYSLVFRKPVGRHVILICDSITCWIMKYDEIVAHLKKSLGIGLGETTEDERFTLLPIPCLGNCDHAPTMMVDDDLHQDLTPQKVDEILAKYT